MEIYIHSSTSWHVLLPFLIYLWTLLLLLPKCRISCDVRSFVHCVRFVFVQTIFLSCFRPYRSIFLISFCFIPVISATQSLSCSLSLSFSVFFAISVSILFSLSLTHSISFSRFDYYWYSNCSFVIWSRAKYWICYKWYYFML